MSVYENMAFGLKLRSTPRQRSTRACKEAADILGIEELLDRKPGNSRAASASASPRPGHRAQAQGFLFDEPLSNLDAKLRVAMRAEISKLHRRLGATIDLRHPRPGGGHDHGRPHRRDARRRAPADRRRRWTSTRSRRTASSPASSARRR